MNSILVEDTDYCRVLLLGFQYALRCLLVAPLNSSMEILTSTGLPCGVDVILESRGEGGEGGNMGY